MQLAGSLLELVDAPLDLRKVPLCARFEDAKRTQESRDFNFSLQFVIAAIKHSIACALPKAQTPAFGGQQALDIHTACAEYTPIHRFKLLDAQLLVYVLPDRVSDPHTELLHYS